MDLIKKYFGERLKYIRKVQNFTQEKLAEKADINQRQLAKIEAGQSFISSESLFRICNALDIEPYELFNFSCKQEYLKTGTGNNVHFSVIKSGNIFQLVNSKLTNQSSQQLNNIDKNMLRISQNIGKEIIVDQINEGTVIGTKIYKPDGRVEIKENNINNLYEEVKEILSEIQDDNNKLEFVKAAITSFNDKESLEKLKFMIKGLEINSFF